MDKPIPQFCSSHKKRAARPAIVGPSPPVPGFFFMSIGSFPIALSEFSRKQPRTAFFGPPGKVADRDVPPSRNLPEPVINAPRKKSLQPAAGSHFLPKRPQCEVPKVFDMNLFVFLTAVVDQASPP